jgi:SAM-dependent methyltransferase
MWQFLTVFIGVLQLALAVRAVNERKTKFAEARAVADSSGKGLLVVGGPWGGSSLRTTLNRPAHGHGDVCLDRNPDSCREDHFVLGDVRDIPFPDGHFGAVVCFHVLEHLPTEDVQTAFDELHRVADEVFICVPTRGDIIGGWLPPDHKSWVNVVDGVVVARSMRPDWMFG